MYLSAGGETIVQLWNTADFHLFADAWTESFVSILVATTA
jgi:hypothetical protein